MKLEQEPRIEAGPNFMFSLKDILRRVAQAVNRQDGSIETHSTQIAATDSALAALSSGLVGLIAMFGANAVPTGWLKANGATVSRTAYAALFARIGTTYGAGDGSTTFGLPDIRGEFPRGWDDGRGIDASRVFGSSQAQAVQPHTHTTVAVGTPGTGAVTGFVITTTGAPQGAFATSSTGTPETRPRNVALLACIKF